MEVITIEKTKFLNKCSELIALVGYKPQLVIGIQEGGSHVMTAIEGSEQLLNSNFALAKLNRPIRHKKSKLFVAPLLKVLPKKFTDWLRLYEIDVLKKKIPNLDKFLLEHEKIDVDITLQLDMPVEKILIVDDALDSGRTMFIVKHNINKIFPNAQIKTAVITWTLNESIIKPDYYLYKNVLVRFPWSNDY